MNAHNSLRIVLYCKCFFGYQKAFCALQEFEFLAQLVKCSGYRQPELDEAVSSAVPATWTDDQRKQLLSRLAVYCQPPTPAGSSVPKSRIAGFLWVP